VRFGEGAALPVPEGEAARATFALEINEWNGAVEPRLRLRHAVAAEAGAENAEDEQAAPASVPAGEQLALL
jgi:hypothetical protein